MKKFILIASLLLALLSAGQAFAGSAETLECSFLFLSKNDDAAIAKIHDQMSPCGSVSCMAHAATTKLENMVYLKTGKRIPLSTPHLIANAARLRFQLLNGVNSGPKTVFPGYSKIQTAEQNLIFEAALKFGVVPEAVWQPPGLFGPVADRTLNLKFLLEAPIETLMKGQFLNNQAMYASFDRRLTEQAGPMPESFEFEGKTYTPKQFAAEILPNYKQQQILIEGQESMNKGFAELTPDATKTMKVEDALELAAASVDRGEAVAASMIWNSRYRHVGIWSIKGKPQTLFLKTFYHGMVIVNYSRDANGRIEWLKFADTHGLVRGGKPTPFEGHYFVHRSYFEPYMLRLYLFNNEPSIDEP